MKARIVQLVLLAALVGCASQSPTGQAEAGSGGDGQAASAEKQHELAGLSGDLARLNRAKPTEVDGYRKVVRNGEVRYCLIGTFTGSKMYKTRCLTETAYLDQRKRNEESLRMLRGRALGPDTTGDSAGANDQTRYQNSGGPQ